MNTSKIIKSLSAVALGVIVFVASCKKDREDLSDIDITSASDNNMAERIANDVSNIGSAVSEDASSSNYRAVSIYCASITRDTVNKIITVTFNGQACSDGYTRSGVLSFNYSGSTNGAKYYRHPGFHVVVTSTNYVVNGMPVTINKTVSNTTTSGFNPANTNLSWSVVDNITITKSNGTITWNASKQNTLLNTSDANVYHGTSLPISWDKARVGITGNASGVTAEGVSYTANVTTQLIVDFNCSPNALFAGRHPFISGTLDFTPGSKAVRHIDFGYPNRGACDDSVLITVNGKTYPRSL